MLCCSQANVHSFSAMIIPHFSSEEDRLASPYVNEDWYTERHSWQWISTVNRVNSLVRKVCLIMSASKSDKLLRRSSWSTSRYLRYPLSSNPPDCPEGDSALMRLTWRLFSSNTLFAKSYW